MAGEPIDLGSFDIIRGDAWAVSLNAFQPDDVTPLNLATTYAAAGGWTAQYRASPDSQTSGIVTLGTASLATGILGLSLDGTATTAMGAPGAAITYVFDVQVTGGASSPITVYRGTFTIAYKDVTRP